MSKHLEFLTPEEKNELYGLPRFDTYEQQTYFVLTKQEWMLMDTYRSFAVKVYFILQLGYFKATRQFYTFGFKDVAADIVYLRAKYFPSRSLEGLLQEKVSSPTRKSQKRDIATIFGYQFCRAEVKRSTLAKAKKLIRAHAAPIYVFRKILDHFSDQRIVLPSYPFMQREIITPAVLFERTRLSAIVSSSLSQEDIRFFDGLLAVREGISLLTWLQKEPANFGYGQMQQQLQRKRVLTPYYRSAITVVGQLGLSNENIAHYALLCNYYMVFQLKQLQGKMMYVYLLCFVYTHWLQLNDLLVEGFVHHTGKIKGRAKNFADKQEGLLRTEFDQYLHKLPEILEVLISDRLAKDTPFEQVKQYIYTILSPESLLMVQQHLLKRTWDRKFFRWQYYDTQKQWTTLNIRPLFTNTRFEGTASQKGPLEMVTALQSLFDQKKRLNGKKVVTDCKERTPKHQTRYVCPGNTLIPARYEMMVYQMLNRRLGSGDISVRDSLRYRSFEQDLIGDKDWRDKGTLFNKTGLVMFKRSPAAILDRWKEEIDEQYHILNERIGQGENTGITLTRSKTGKKWKWTAPDADPRFNHRFYEQFPSTHLVQVLTFVQEQTDFMSAFTHFLEINPKQKLDKRTLLACIVALGTNYSLYQMAQISDMDQNDLEGTTRNFMRMETLQAANDLITNAYRKLPMFQYYNVDEDTVHSSSDGQKFSVQYDTVNARHSPKYYGLGKGVSAYSLIANHIPVHAKIIGAHEHESHYVFDLLYNNTSEVRPETHSVDTHGTNQVNFAILDFFGYQFAPRYAQITDRTENLCTLGDLNEHGAYIIRANYEAKTKLIMEEWDNIGRIMVSLALKSTTQSEVWQPWV